MKWISVKDKMPENIGCYLCYTNDDLNIVCRVNVVGWWTIAISGKFSGDMGNTVLNSKTVEREVTHWMPLPESPQ